MNIGHVLAVVLTFACATHASANASFPATTKKIEKIRKSIESEMTLCPINRADWPGYGFMLNSCRPHLPEVAAKQSMGASCVTRYNIDDAGIPTDIRIACNFSAGKTGIKLKHAARSEAAVYHTVFKALMDTRYVPVADSPAGSDRDGVVRHFIFKSFDKNNVIHEADPFDESVLDNTPLYLDLIRAN